MKGSRVVTVGIAVALVMAIPFLIFVNKPRGSPFVGKWETMPGMVFSPSKPFVMDIRSDGTYEFIGLPARGAWERKGDGIVLHWGASGEPVQLDFDKEHGTLMTRFSDGVIFRRSPSPVQAFIEKLTHSSGP